MKNQYPLAGAAFVITMLAAPKAPAQDAAHIITERCVGGPSIDELVRLRSNMDISAIGSSLGAGGDIPSNAGGYDAWRATLDAGLNISFSNVTGSAADEKAVDLVNSGIDEMTMLMGTTGTFNGCTGGAINNIIVSKRHETSWSDLGSICQTGNLFDDGVRFFYIPGTDHFIEVANVRSTAGFYSSYTHHGQVDIGVFEFDHGLNLLNGALIGSSGFDIAHDAWTNGTELWIGGESDGTNGDMAGTTAYGSDDLVMLKWDIPSWSLTNKFRFGGSFTEHVQHITRRPGGGFVIWGNTLSNGFCNCTDAQSNAIALGMSSTGTLDWTKCLQGSGVETFKSGIWSSAYDRHFFIGYGNSDDNDFAGNPLGGYDAFIGAMRDLDGFIEWLHNYGGTGDDFGMDLLELLDELFTLNQTASTDIDVQSNNNGQRDAWFVKFTHTTGVDENDPHMLPLSISPVPTQDLITVQLPKGTVELDVLDLDGRVVQRSTTGGFEEFRTLDLSALGSGAYVIEALTPRGTARGRCVKM